jgi:F-type H+-transporting ATPase subunit delta
VKGDLVASKYAHGLFEAAREADGLDRLYDEAESLLAYLREERRLHAFWTAPQIPDQDKEQIVRQAFEHRVSPLFLSFLLLLVDRHRIGYLPEMLDLFIERVKDHRGIVDTRVYSAFPLDDDERERIAAHVARRTGKQVELTVVVDPGLIGGIVVMVGNQVIDYSLKHFLDQLRGRLLALKV